MVNGFQPLANTHVPVQSRVLSASCCPDKDLVLLVSRLGGIDRLSLWNSNSGGKIWEVNLGEEDEVVQLQGIAWSPDRQSIACILNPPRVSLYSIQDGRIVTTLPLQGAQGNPDCCLTGVWWFSPRAKPLEDSPIPDIFRRNGIIPGSAESILKNLPYLDSLQEESDKLTATSLFAFQGSQPRSHSKSSLPEVITAWPTLSTDPRSSAVDSTIQSPAFTSQEETLDEKDESNLNSILMISDALGKLHSFLDGAFPLGVVTLGRAVSFSTVEKSNRDFRFFGHAQLDRLTASTLCVIPTIVYMPLLGNRKTRDLARLSSIVRDLVWYITRVVREMKEAWMGSEGITGARELGPKFIESLRTKQQDHGKASGDPILDLTWLLTTGRTSEALADFLGSGEQLSERGLQRWETMFNDALSKIRDYAEKRLAPAYQRIHIIVEELQGWQHMPQCSVFEFQTDQLERALGHAARGILLAGRLAVVARKENFRFKEFTTWLRFEIAKLGSNVPAEVRVPIRHDLLEVNNYFMSGLVTSELDSWFEGEIPQFDPRQLGVPKPGAGSLDEVLNRAMMPVMHSSLVEWQENISRDDQSATQRNLVALTDDLTATCRSIFSGAAGAASRSALVHHLKELPPLPTGTSTQSTFRERIVQEGQVIRQYFITAAKDHNVLVLFQNKHASDGADLTLRAVVAKVQVEDSELNVKPLAADFFDDETVMAVCQTGKGAFIFTFPVPEFDHLVEPDQAGYGTFHDVLESTISGWKSGKASA